MLEMKKNKCGAESRKALKGQYTEGEEESMRRGHSKRRGGGQRGEEGAKEMKRVQAGEGDGV